MKGDLQRNINLYYSEMKQLQARACSIIKYKEVMMVTTSHDVIRHHQIRRLGFLQFLMTPEKELAYMYSVYLTEILRAVDSGWVNISRL